MTKTTRIGCIIGALLISGCASITSPYSAKLWNDFPIAVPLQPTLQQEIKLNQIDNVLLNNPKITTQDKANLFFERGLLNDSLGLRDIAYTDFNRSLSFNPKQPHIYNILGTYYTLNSMYDEAYEVFDSALELQPDNVRVQKNLAIALYYGNRFQLAKRELLAADYPEREGYQALWLYLIEAKQEGKKQALANLKTRFDAAEEHSDWGWQIARLYLDKTSQKDFFSLAVKTSMDNRQLAQRLCESYFYLAKYYQSIGDESAAITLYKLAMSTNLYGMLEHRYALLELSLIAQRS